MKPPAVFFHLGKRNWYSHVPLINCMEESGLGIEPIPSWNVEADLAENPERLRTFCCVSFFTTQIRQIRGLVDRIRRRHGAAVTLIAGGPHPTGDAQGALDIGFDYVITGEGEIVLPSLIEGLVEEDPELRERRILDGEPIPDLDLFPPVSLKHHLYPPIEITRGCLHGCEYCAVPKGGAPLRHRSVESVVETGRDLLRLRGSWDFRFISPNSFGYGSFSLTPNASAIENLLSSIRDLRGRKRIFFATFPSEARPDFVTEEVVQVVRELADNGSISIGAQSGSERMLEMINRGHGPEAIFRACEIIIANGLVPDVDFILGLPGETPTDQAETLKAMQCIVRMGGEVRVHHFLPLAGSRMAGMRPSPVSGEVMKEIGRMSLRGQASGSFTQQAKLAAEIIGWQDLSSSSG